MNDDLSKSQEEKISKKDAIHQLWRKGILTWKLDKNQLEMYDTAINSPHKLTVFGCSRQIGKTYFLTTLALQTCLQIPNAIVKFVAPTRTDLRKIIAPLVREITADCPEDLKPDYISQDHIYRFPHNGSEIHLAGTDNGHADSIRGNKAHLCIVDEAGFCSELRYVVNSILLPTTTTTKGKIIMASTPPPSMDHVFIEYMRKAAIDGAFVKKTIYDNPRLSKEDIQMLAEAAGGEDSSDFRREYLVELITNPEEAVIPEFTKELKEAIVREWERPPFFDTYESMDIGVKDMTVVLFSYYDFRSAKLIIEDELVMSGSQLVTDDLAQGIKDIERKLWTSSATGEVKKVHLRVADNNNLILINDLNIKHSLPFVTTAKDEAMAALNNLRLLLKKQQIIINPRCKTLIYHLENAIWNKARTSFARSLDKGHFDALDSCKILCRNVNFSKNPFPDNYEFQKGDNFFSLPSSKENKLNEQIKSALPPQVRKIIRRHF